MLLQMDHFSIQELKPNIPPESIALWLELLTQQILKLLGRQDLKTKLLLVKLVMLQTKVVLT